MKADTAKCSEITLPEIGGLVINLIQKLIGKRGRFWLNALKRLDRKENPWIPFRKILDVPQGSRHLPSVRQSLDTLSELKITIFEGMDEIKDSTVEHLSNNQDLPRHDVVLVKLGDLLTHEERVVADYGLIIEKAGEHGFEICGLREGFNAAVVLARETISNDHSMGSIAFLICTEITYTDGHQRVPLVSVKCGLREESQGLATRLAVDMKPNSKLENPNTGLLLRSIPW